jgi:flagellar biogenesis protein FliO
MKKLSRIGKGPLGIACAAWLALGAASVTSNALEPAGGSPQAQAPAADGDRDASAEDTSATAERPALPAARSWLARSSTAPVVEGSAPAASGSSTGFTLGAVLIVLALGAAAVVIRFKKQKQLPLAPSESRLTVLSSSRVGPKAFAVTAHVNGRVLLLGVTDHNVSNLGWLDTREPEAQRAHEEPEAEEADGDDELPDDYPGSALRASTPPQTFASASDLRRFQEVLRGAVQSRTDLPLRPSYAPPPPSDAASQLAAQTTDVVGPSAGDRPAMPVSLRRKRRARESLPPRQERARESAAPREPRARESLTPREPRAGAQGRAPSASEASLEGQVAGLRSLRNGG